LWAISGQNFSSQISSLTLRRGFLTKTNITSSFLSAKIKFTLTHVYCEVEDRVGCFLPYSYNGLRIPKMMTALTISDIVAAKKKTTNPMLSSSLEFLTRD
jgi:hypothetical protein